MSTRRNLLAAVSALAFLQATPSFSQTSPNLTQGQVPTAGQWNSYFAGKQDYPLAQPPCTVLQWTGSLITCNNSIANGIGTANKITAADDSSSATTYYPLALPGFGATFSPFTAASLYFYVPNTGLLTWSGTGGLSLTGPLQGKAGANLGQPIATTAWLNIAAGTASIPAQQFDSGTLQTTPNAGSVEYDGNALYATAQAGNRGAVVAESLCTGSTDFALSQGSAAQKAFNCSATGQINFAANITYQMECSLLITNTGTGAHAWLFGITGGATYSAINYTSITNASTSQTPGNAQSTFVSTAAVTTVTSSVNSATEFTQIYLRGVLRTTGAGTAQPLIKLSAAIGAGTTLMKAGSFCRFWPIGSVSVNVVGNWN